MFLMEALLALVMALLFTAVFALGFRRRGPWSSVLTFFLIVFLAAWAGSLWLSPAGPVFLGIYWLPIIMAALFFALLLSAMAPPRPPTQKVETISQVKEEERAIRRVYDAFFWTLLVGFVAIIILGYAFRQTPIS